jgi:hypothetical protein
MRVLNYNIDYTITNMLFNKHLNRMALAQ